MKFVIEIVPPTPVFPSASLSYRYIDIFVNCNWVAPGGSSTVHFNTQTVHRTTQLTTLVGRFSGIQTQSCQTKINDELTV